MIFQDPYASLNPRRTIFQSMEEPLELFKLGDKGERKEKVIEMLNEVGIGREHLDKFPMKCQADRDRELLSQDPLY